MRKEMTCLKKKRSTNLSSSYKIIKFWQQKAIQPVLYFHLSFILY